MINFQKPNYYHYDANLSKRAYEGNAKEMNRPARAEESNETRKSELKEQLQGKDNRLSYTSEQLKSIGFNDSNACYGSYFDASSDNILDLRAGTVTYKLKRGLKVNGKEIKTVYELLKALNNGMKIEVPDMKNPPIRTDFYKM